MYNVDFCKRMLGNIYSASYYPIKRSFGQTLQTCPIDALIAYSKLSKTKNRTQQNIEFLVAGLCYNTIKPDQNRPTFVRFETVLRRLNREKDIENFLKLRYDDTGYFANRFMSLAKKVIPLLSPNEQFDYIHLISDLVDWNKNNNTKMRWAMSILNLYEVNEETTNNEENEEERN